MTSSQERINDPSEAQPVRCIAFAGNRRIACGTLRDVALKVKNLLDKGEADQILIFDDSSSQLIEVAFRGTAAEVEKRLAVQTEKPALPPEKRGPGRPKLGVVGREVTLLPRHWDWLDQQPSGASVALRKLVESAKRENREKDQARRSQEAAYRFMSAMAGDLPGFEEASRAFYSGDQDRLAAMIKGWPHDIREQVKKLISVAARDEAAARQKEMLKGQRTENLGQS